MNSPLFLRVHTRVEGEKTKKASKWRRRQFATYALVLDTETTIDQTQSLTFGFYLYLLPAARWSVCVYGRRNSLCRRS